MIDFPYNSESSSDNEREGSSRLRKHKQKERSKKVSLRAAVRNLLFDLVALQDL